MPTKPNLYSLLGLPKDATPDEIRRAYHDAALKLHPDVNVETGATERFLQIKDAYEVLNDPKKRNEYDERLVVENNDPIAIDIQYSRPTIAILDEPQIMYVLLELSAMERFISQPSPPLNICLVLDRSTSMQGSRMDTVKLASIELLRQLKADDLLSIVTFSDRAEVLLPAGKRMERHQIETEIRMIRASGGTEIFQGLEAGYSEVCRNQTRSLINHIILVTDGRTYGDEELCLQLADKAATQGVRITGLGMGTDWNDIFLDELTARTGSTSFYVSKSSDIRTFLQEKFDNLNQVFAERLTLKLNMFPEIIITSAFRLQPDTAVLSSNSPLRLGSIPKSSKLSILLEFSIPSVDAEENRVWLTSGELNLVLPFDPASVYKIPISLSRLTSDTISTDLPPRPIFQALSLITLFRMQERARQEVAEGKVEDASLRLQRLGTQLLSLGQADLAHTAFMEAERIRQTHMLSAEGEKRMKYGTRSLMLPARIGEGLLT
jgi:Ca-activated chloride channel family protein